MEKVRVRWNEAIVAVIKAQIAYADLMSQPDLDEKALDAAWLRLWRAREQERSAARELEHIAEERSSRDQRADVSTRRMKFTSAFERDSTGRNPRLQ